MEPGLEATRRHRVTEADTASSLGSGDLPVLATPRLIAWLEGAAVAAVAPSLEPDVTTVGARIEVDHLAPSPVGGEVTVSARLLDVAGSRLEFLVDAAQDGGAVARGHHVRYVVDRVRFLEKVEPQAS